MNIKRIGLVLLFAGNIWAQWLNYPTAGIPRLPNGKPNLSAPAPRTPDGKPDLSGLWQQPNGVKYTVNLAADLKPGDVVMTPSAAALYKERQDNLSKDDPVGHCNLAGVPQMNAVPYPYKIIQRSDMVAILYEALQTFRQIFTDGRELPKDPNPAWMGYSIGHWDGDTLVVETVGQNDITWLDEGGIPHSTDMKVTERIRRPDYGHLEIEHTIEDPKTFSKPWKFTTHPVLLRGELIEYICQENNKDVQHLVGK